MTQTIYHGMAELPPGEKWFFAVTDIDRVPACALYIKQEEATPENVQTMLEMVPAVQAVYGVAYECEDLIDLSEQQAD